MVTNEELIAALRGLNNAANVLLCESEEYDFPDGMGKGASQDYWDALDSALEKSEETLARALLARADESQCPCGDRPAAKCPGEWEQGCDLGSNAKYAQAEPPPPDAGAEPVAWLSQGGDVSRSRRYFEEMGFTNLTPLYATPQPAIPDGWIPVSERMPEPNQPVALIDIRRMENTGHDRFYQDVGYLSEQWACWSIRGERGRVLDAYTHWTPLPQPPKEGE